MKILILSFLLFPIIVVRGQVHINGKVADLKGEAIPGANITIKDTYDGASSDENGLFGFTTLEKGPQILVVSFVGYKTHQQQIILSGNTIRVEVKLKEEVNQLDAVTISAGSFTAGEEKRRTILKAVDIATTAGATADIAGALNTLPGTQKVGESGRLFVRGGDGTETRTFIDGLVVIDAYGPSAPNTPGRGRFLPFMFKGTSFSTGGYSAEYGQALSSALVLTSKDKAEITQTDIGVLSVGADVAHTQVWNNASLSGKIQYTDIRPYFNLVNQRIDWQNPPVSLEGSGALRKQIGKGGMLKVFSNINRTRFSLYNHDIQNPSIKQLQSLKNNYGYGNLSYSQSINNSWLLRGGLSYTEIINHIQQNTIPFGVAEKGIHGKAVAEYSPNDQLQINFGTEVFGRSYEATRWNQAVNKYERLAFQETLPVGFTELEYFLSKHFVVKAGGRFEYNSLNKNSSIDPRVSLAWKPGAIGQFSFAYGKFRQSAKNDFVRYNHRLSSERAEHFILNYQMLTNGRTFRAEAYYKNYDQLVKYNSGNPIDLNNKGYGYARGFELFWRDSQSVKNIDYWISYSFLDTKRDYLNFPHLASPTFASKHNLSIVYKHFIQKLKTQVGTTYSVSSGRSYFNPNSESFHADKTPTYQDLSLNISHLPKSWLIIHVSCTNVLGSNNIFGYEFSSAPDANGVYAGRAIRQAAPRFLFLGVFVTLSKNKSINQLPNL